MSLSYMELLYLAAYFILLYEFVTMRHMGICAESDRRIDDALWDRGRVSSYKLDAQYLYWNRGTK